jgi:hypothetical protein
VGAQAERRRNNDKGAPQQPADGAEGRIGRTGWEPFMFKATSAGGETRQAMLRVWMAISAVWVAFWLSIATITALTSEAFASPLLDRLDLIGLIVVAPPFVFLAFGVLLRCGYEMIALRRSAR